MKYDSFLNTKFDYQKYATFVAWNRLCIVEPNGNDKKNVSQA